MNEWILEIKQKLDQTLFFSGGILETVLVGLLGVLLFVLMLILWVLCF